jgi:hypothetical protein
MDMHSAVVLESEAERDELVFLIRVCVCVCR